MNNHALTEVDRRLGRRRLIEEFDHQREIDVKPKHGSPDFARDIAFQKIANRVKGVALASQELGI